MENRFWTKVDRRGDGECWPWLAGRNKDGYGTFWLDRPGVLATHVSLMLAGKPRPIGLIALHSCDSPSCVNPAHLRWGTRGENSREMSDKGRTLAQRKTHCRNGHEFTRENTRIDTASNGRPSRRCRKCNAAAVARGRENLR